MREHIESEESPKSSGAWLIVIACAIAAVTIASSAQAIPAFARSEGQDCGYCHDTVYPKLNETGLTYKFNGYRFKDVEVTNVWDSTGGIPLSIIAEIEGFIDSAKDDATNERTTTGPDGKIDEVELMFAGNLGPRVSTFGEIEFDSGGNSELGPVWAQFNDVYGSLGQANVRVGQFAVELPFLAEGRRVVRNKYLAFEKMGFLDTEFGIELNGQIGGEQAGSNQTQRYGAGLIRSDDAKDHNSYLRGFGWYSHTWNETNNAGILLIGGQEFDSDIDRTFKTLGVGIGAETQVGDLTFNAGYFFRYKNFDGSVFDRKMHNVMGEVIFTPNDHCVLAGRLDYMKETERSRDQDWGLRASVLARYNIVANVWAGGEYRLDDGGTGSPLTSNETVHKGRLFVFIAI